MKRCVVIGGAPLDISVNKLLQPKDVVICADKGYISALAQNIQPDLIIGDFDSSDYPEFLKDKVVQLPVEKDDTDTFYIARYLVEHQFTDVLLCAVTGGKRAEHTIANIQTLAYFAKNRVNATIIDKYSTYMVIENGSIVLPPMQNKFFSLFSMNEQAKGVSIAGAKYLLTDQTISNDYPVGISNEFLDTPVEIQVKEGRLLLIITEKD